MQKWVSANCCQLTKFGAPVALHTQAMATAHQHSQIRLWAGLEPDKAEAATKGLWPAVLENVKTVRMAQQSLAIEQVQLLCADGCF